MSQSQVCPILDGSLAIAKECSIPEYSPAMKLQPKQIDYTYFFNDTTAKRKPSELRELSRLVDQLPPGSIKLGVGVPNVHTFPFKGFDVELASGEVIKLNEGELAAALQYLPSIGYTPLINKLKEIQDQYHGAQNWKVKSIMVSSGAQEGLSKAVDMCMRCGDAVIMPDPTYTGAIDLFRLHDAEIIGIKQDSQGVLVKEMEKVLASRKKKNQLMPKVIYLNPTACNPCGTTIPTNRKREIYRLACEYNLLILEDDPYYYLSFENVHPTSFMSMDTEGRVLRFDSLSKIMSSGLRVGFVTGHNRLLRQMELHMQTSSMHTSSLSQVLVHKLLSHWDNEGLVSHFLRVKKFYKQKRDHMLLAVKKHLSGLAEWYVPCGGMFLWLKVIGLKDTRCLVTARCLEKNVILAPGYALAIDPKKPSPYIRVSFSIASHEDVDRGISLLAEAIREEIQAV
ncbi:kynurenine/alpha-aminoadipate aminotransferase, mitochondrial-like [Adelges cooleyi]|uniref:kynurenine/alpha-aminoadipate aminotransferase, mitochondrial-like n=1 Tax=Adelges cooleyi TaxID=133065 RepID=UPI00217F9FCB|nr:kynurenine/alpha-aminoadipate aminotransferase, mitochondrial-like [Adelges cooleyi]XP_050442578.1 kynurenine/alpha-aminoadipate aminotransferase, mitochondrial-like [Adelges cooleyi]XP_050442579.1 kynurenine/alpha-aminoadipate aminotransferase, mitochondrial-like [Adelges cooleyi]XP_050442580.1 kynurenine/alpha-aminoadipate aminotransferase, mitochondrial-like [Adelges cooleyi]XP_050442581.1 kynurenine/alpha-aminoadipate aminotransferase, mitochondrial-like [Adelges cooleyi]